MSSSSCLQGSGNLQVIAKKICLQVVFENLADGGGLWMLLPPGAVLPRGRDSAVTPVGMRSGQGQSTLKPYIVPPRAMPHAINLPADAGSKRRESSSKQQPHSQLEPNLINDGDLTTSVGYTFQWIMSSLSLFFFNIFSHLHLLFFLCLCLELPLQQG